MPLGDIFGFAITPLFVDDKDPLPIVKQNVIRYCMWAAIFVTALGMPMVLFFKDKPKYYPSRAARKITNTDYGFKRDMLELMKNTNFWLICTCVAT
jgi:hypothetical protein